MPNPCEIEADMNEGKVWMVTSYPRTECGLEVVDLKGYSGPYVTAYLERLPE